ncbi:MAG: hypothetical protein HYX82_03865 [Chloroflexi bacterium]|nr:hypothetical protein [Chloroflexota bacterium]
MSMKLKLPLTAADIKYKRCAVRALYKANPNFFPGEGTQFELRMDVDIIKTNVTKRSYRIGKGMHKWFEAHSELKPRSLIEFEKISPMVFYLRVCHIAGV